jgi:hypothetical protein
MKTIRHFLVTTALLVAVVVGFAPSVSAQTTLNSTTLSAAVAGTLPGGGSAPQVIPLASVTNIAVKDILVVDREFMCVTALNTGSVQVQRGCQGTAAAGHVSGAVVWTGAKARFYSNEVTGSCTATNEAFLPHIVMPSGNEYDCKNGEWSLSRREGFREFNWGRSDGGTTYTANGAITVQPGVTFINGTTLAMTLADPTKDQNGMVMFIISTNASAHTVTYTAGFGGGTTARDVATFGGAINDELVIVAVNGTWWLVSTRNVTLG